MKHKLLTISLLFPFLVAAESNKMGFRNLFFSGGMNYTTLKKTPSIASFTQKTTALLDKSFGIGFQYSLDESWALMVETNLSSISYEISEVSEFRAANGTIFRTSTQLKSQKKYTEIPITFLHYPTENKRFYVGAGFGVSILRKIKVELEETNNNFSNAYTREENIALSDGDISLNIKALVGFKMPMNDKTSFRIEPYIILRENSDGFLFSSFNLSSNLHQISYGVSLALSFGK